jgi:energy-coupling factor transport system ATP-binding protein
MGLNVPQITRIFMGLRSKGVDVKEGIFTVEQGRNEIERLLKSRGVLQ